MRPMVCIVFLATAANGLCACSPSATSGLFKSPTAGSHPLALATFEEARLPIAPNSHGVMAGYIPAPEGGVSDDPKDARFTYLIDFRVVSSRGMGEQLEWRGVRRIFFSPRGAHASFGDLSSFSHGRQIETDTVRLTGDYTSADTLLTLQMRVYESRVEAVQFEGQPVAAPDDEPLRFLGIWRDNVNGWMLTSSPTNF